MQKFWKFSKVFYGNFSNLGIINLERTAAGIDVAPVEIVARSGGGLYTVKRE